MKVKSKTRRLMMTAALLAPTLVLPQASLAADSYPSRPITMVLPFAAGGSTDTMARLLAKEMSTALGQQIIVDNRPGASGIIGANHVATAAKDGYTMLFSITSLIQVPHLQQVPFDVFDDLQPVSQVALSLNCLAVATSLGVNTVDEYIALAKKDPRRAGTYGSFGNGTTSHIYGEVLKNNAEVDLVHVPYKGASPEIMALMAGDLASAFLDVATANSYRDSGKYKVLAIAGSRRSSLFPDVPTFAELGYEGMATDGWYGAFLPTGTPKPIVDKLSTAMVEAAKSPAVQKRLDEMGVIPAMRNADEFSAVLKPDYEVWGKHIVEQNIRVD